MEIGELRTKDVVELNEELQALLREQFNLRVQFNTGEKPKANALQKVRRNIARVKTVLREKVQK